MYVGINSPFLPNSSLHTPIARPLAEYKFEPDPYKPECKTTKSCPTLLYEFNKNMTSKEYKKHPHRNPHQTTKLFIW